MTTVRFQRLPEYNDVNLPAYQSAGAAGIDLFAAQAVTIPPGLMRRVSTGFNVKIPDRYEGQVRSRSGMAFKCRTVVLNAPGTIDSDYTGELFVMLQNHSAQPVNIEVNDRVAQLVVSPVVRANIREVEAMPTTARGGGGFGSTGGMPTVDGVLPYGDKSVEGARAVEVLPRGQTRPVLQEELEALRGVRPPCRCYRHSGRRNGEP